MGTVGKSDLPKIQNFNHEYKTNFSQFALNNEFNAEIERLVSVSPNSPIPAITCGQQSDISFDIHSPFFELIDKIFVAVRQLGPVFTVA